MTKCPEQLIFGWTTFEGFRITSLGVDCENQQSMMTPLMKMRHTITSVMIKVTMVNSSVNHFNLTHVPLFLETHVLVAKGT